MICTCCFEADYITSTTELTVTVNGVPQVLRDVECEKCPECGDITYSHAQSLEIDKKRVALEFGVKPLLTPFQLKTFRRIMDMNLDAICEVLCIGKNTYGRWERGEVEITPSMNLLVHNFIEKVPGARVNIFEYERIAAIEKANTRLLGNEISLGEYIRKVIETTKLLPDMVCSSVGIPPTDLTRLQNNDIAPENLPYDIAAKIAHFFRLSIDSFKNLLNSALAILEMKSSVTVHARSTCYDGKGASIQASSVNKILEILAQKKGGTPIPVQRQVSEDYLIKVNSLLIQLNRTEE